MHRFLYFWLLLVLPTWADDPATLSRANQRFLEKFTALRPGQSVEQVRKHFPELGEIGDSIDPWTEKTQRADIPVFFLGGASWEGEFYFRDGQFRGARLSVINRDPFAPPQQNIVLERSDGRRLKATLMRHLDDRLGARPELHVPVLECPAGNPYFLMKYWPAPKHVVAVNYEGMDGTANLWVSIWEKRYWMTQYQKGFEELWPFKPE